MSEEQKLNSPKYVSISVIERNVKNTLLIVSVLGLIAVGVRKYDLTFNTQDEKIKTLNHKQTFHVEERQILNVINSVDNNTKGIQDLKQAIDGFILEQKEVNMAVGQDLQIIKQRQ